jgi:hypothetical protein
VLRQGITAGVAFKEAEQIGIEIFVDVDQRIHLAELDAAVGGLIANLRGRDSRADFTTLVATDWRRSKRMWSLIFFAVCGFFLSASISFWPAPRPSFEAAARGPRVFQVGRAFETGADVLRGLGGRFANRINASRCR